MLLSIFYLLEKHIKQKSSTGVSVCYTPKKILFRGFFAGLMIAIAVLLSNVGETISGIFSVFPAIFLSTMIIFLREHGPIFTGAMGKSMIFGSPTVVTYAISLHYFYPAFHILWGTLISYSISLFVVLLLFKLRNKIE
jgi:hypothetical protein